jgi:hypothetical protein
MEYIKDMTYYDPVSAHVIIMLPDIVFSVVYGLRLQLSGGGTAEFTWQNTSQNGANGHWQIYQEWTPAAELPIKFAIRRELVDGRILGDWSDWSDVIPVRSA